VSAGSLHSVRAFTGNFAGKKDCFKTARFEMAGSSVSIENGFIFITNL
jgi:hypothetical protein